MVKKNILLNFIIIFFYLFSYIKSEDIIWITYDFSQGYGEKISTSSPQKQSFAVDFTSEQGDIPFYIKVQVTSDYSNPAPLLCFSNSDPSCDTREQLVKNPNGKSTFFWVKREQFGGYNEKLYITAECEQEGCDYTVKVEGSQSAIFEPNFVYSYLVTTYNREMIFEIQGNQKMVYMTISLDGSSKALLNIENAPDIIEKYKTGSSISFYIPEDETKNSDLNLAKFKVSAGEVGEYLTISVHLYTSILDEGIAENGALVPNGGVITGLLDESKIREECFPINLGEEKYSSMSKLYITGKIHTKYAWFFLEDKNRNYLEDTFVDISNEQLSFAMENNGELNYICLELPDEEDFKISTMIYSISLTEPNSLPELYNYYPPQLTGEIYRRIIPKGSIAFFSAIKLDNSAEKYDYSLYQIKGVTKMYIGDCRFYPDCHYSEQALGNLIETKNTNQMTIWTTTDSKSSAIGREKYVIVAHCIDDDNDNNGYCEFETSIFNKGQNIFLIENEKFSKFVVSGEKGVFIADLQNQKEVQSLTFDIMIFSGDVTFSVRDTSQDIQISYNKYYLSNKIFININLGREKIGQIIVDYTAKINSFFTIQYGYDVYNLNQLQEYIPSGESYLIQIDPTSATKTKKIFLSNKFYKNKNPFLANFFEINCEFEVKRENGDGAINFFDGYAQEVLDDTAPDYDFPYFEYNIKITETDLANYNHKMCMLYIAGYESETKYDREIIIGNNINQQIIFNQNFKKIRFLYPFANKEQEIALHVNVVDKAFYKLTMFIQNLNVREFIITRSQIIYFKGSVIGNRCDPNTLCPITIQVELQSEIIKTDPMIEITIREVKNIPTYLQKGQAKLDFVCGDQFYYLYTDIGKNEIGEITVNFLREFGYLWAKVVRKDQTIPDDDANWRGIYRMPSKDWGDSLSFNQYTKKLFVSSDDTADCIDGCYLLISIQINQIGEYVGNDKFYPFSILTKITPNGRAYTEVPKIVIQVDEFIIGNVDISENEKIFEFFEVWLPHDSEIVLFDWQSSVAGLYINLGGTRPTTKNADFKLLPPGKDSILNLTKVEIIDKANIKKINIPYENSLQDINLVIGIWTDKTDSIDSEIYSLRVHQPDSDLDLENNLDIVEVNTDQKILCNPTFISENEYRCLFVVTYDNEDVNNLTPLLAYGSSINQGAINYMYANFIDRKIYDEYIKTELNSHIPTDQTADLNSRKEGVNYIYLKSLEKDKYVFINVITDKADPIMILTSMPIFNYITYDFFECYPNPSTEQLFFVPGQILRLSFPITDSVTVNIVSLSGKAEIIWKNDPSTVFSLKGVGDRISLSSGKLTDQLIFTQLENINNNINNNKLNAMENPGFVFYASYLIKDNSVNFNEINYGKSMQITYKDSGLPFFLYSKIGSDFRDINIAITFSDNEIDKEGIHETSPLIIGAQLVKENAIYDAKKDTDLRPSEKEIRGFYDSALKTGQVFLSEDIIKYYNIKDTDNPTIYIIIDKDENGEFPDKTFEKFSIEVQVSGVNDGVIPVEDVYHYGRVRNTAWQQTFYRLRTDKKKSIMRIHIAFNSNNLDFVVSDTENKRSNTTFLHSEKKRGKIFVTLKTEDDKELYYLYIFKKSKTLNEEYLNNYAFKYFNVKDESKIVDFPISNSPEITYSENNDGEQDEISCTFNKLEVSRRNANITYFFKVVENSTYYYGEEINTIAVTESPYYTVYKRNPTDSEGKITLKAKGKLSNWVYLNIIAQVQQNNILEYIAYNGKVYLRPDPNKKDSSGINIAVFLGIGGGLLLIILVLVVIIFIIHKRNLNILKQVKSVSFTGTNKAEDPNLLLQQSKQSDE